MCNPAHCCCGRKWATDRSNILYTEPTPVDQNRIFSLLPPVVWPSHFGPASCGQDRREEQQTKRKSQSLPQKALGRHSQFSLIQKVPCCFKLLLPSSLVFIQSHLQRVVWHIPL